MHMKTYKVLHKYELSQSRNVIRLETARHEMEVHIHIHANFGKPNNQENLIFFQCSFITIRSKNSIWGFLSVLLDFAIEIMFCVNTSLGLALTIQHWWKRCSILYNIKVMSFWPYIHGYVSAQIWTLDWVAEKGRGRANQLNSSA